MSNKKKVILSIFIMAPIVVAICLFLFILTNNISFTTGVYFNDNKSEILIVDDEYITLNDAENLIPDSISNGNKMLVIHKGIMESYPPQINVDFALKLSNKISKDVIYPIQEDTIFKNDELDRADASEWFAE